MKKIEQKNHKIQLYSYEKSRVDDRVEVIKYFPYKLSTYESHGLWASIKDMNEVRAIEGGAEAIICDTKFIVNWNKKIIEMMNENREIFVEFEKNTYRIYSINRGDLTRVNILLIGERTNDFTEFSSLRFAK